MPRTRAGLKWLKIPAWGALALAFASGCELVVGDLPAAVDSDATSGKPNSGGTAANAAGGHGTGSVAIGNTGGSGGAAGLGGSGVGGGGASEGGATSSGGAGVSGGLGAGGARDSGGVSNAGGQTANGGAESTGGRGAAGGTLATGGVTASGGRVSTGGASGGVPSAGGASGCKSPPCDCDGDGGLAESCGGDDCDDTDPLVYKNEPAYYASASLHHGFDYDCNNNFDVYPPVNKTKNCGILNLTNCDTVTQGFLSGVVPACGASGDWGTCMQGLTCGDHKLGTQQVTCK